MQKHQQVALIRMWIKIGERSGWSTERISDLHKQLAALESSEARPIKLFA